MGYQLRSHFTLTRLLKRWPIGNVQAFVAKLRTLSVNASDHKLASAC